MAEEIVKENSENSTSSSFGKIPISTDVGNQYKVFVIIMLLGYALICLIAAIHNYSMMWMII